MIIVLANIKNKQNKNVFMGVKKGVRKTLCLLLC